MRELIQKHQKIRISELSKQLQVSEMTIHRDLKPLIEEGVVNRIYGGVEWKAPIESPSNGCILCGRTGEHRLAYRLVLTDQRVETACCPHCGLLRHRQLKAQVMQALCQDFFTNATINADHAWYVFQPQVEIGCCQPQVLCFGRRDIAERFIRGFGGSLHSHASVMDQLHNQMNQGISCSCHSHE